jgi:hypothetical protein
MVTPVPRRPDLARWAALLGLSVVVASASAQAAVQTFVDGAGLCNGQTPCFTTIQAGIKNAGPAPAGVFVFPGTYAESVNLGLMGSVIGGSAGDLMLRAVDSMGVPTTGGVNIFPGAGPALRNSLTPFVGNLQIDGFTVKSLNDTGIALGSVQGSVTLGNITSDGNAAAGFTASITMGFLSVSSSSFSNNLNGSGLDFTAASGAGFEDVTADGNAGSGAVFTVTNAVVNATRSSFSHNTNGDGLNFSGASGVSFDHVTADANQNTGAVFSVAGPVNVSDSSFSDAVNGPGLNFSTATDVTFDGVTADDNQNTGAEFSLTGMLSVHFSSFSGAKNGSGLNFSTATDVTFDLVTADNNQNTNAVFSLSGKLTISRSSFSGSKNGNGLNFSTATDVTLTNVTCDSNSSDDASFSMTGVLTIVGSSFSTSKNGRGLLFSAPTQVSFNHVTANGDQGDGATFSTSGVVNIVRSTFNGSKTGNGLAAELGGAQITGSKFENNAANGVELDPAPPTGSYQLTCDDIDHNATGLRIQDPALINATHDYWGSPTGPTHPNNPGGTGDSIIDGADGGAGTVVFVPFLTAPSAGTEFCAERGAPVMHWPALGLLSLALLALPAWRLKKMRTTDEHK